MLLLISKALPIILSIRIDFDDADVDVGILFFILGIGTLALIIMFIAANAYLKKVLHQDDNLPLETHNCKIIEKTREAGTTSWFTVELSNGERRLLRNLKSATLILAAGDIGVMEIRGQTICTFKRDV